ncbi:hypothetical protein RFI_05930, partial [Reticulomyxa filosa]
MVGIELDEWSLNGNDGSVDGKRYFDCRDSRGYFCAKRHIAENMGPTSLQSANASKGVGIADDDDWIDPRNKNIKAGDRVELDRGRKGVVKWIGVTDFSRGEEMLGIELDDWWINGHDGSQDGQKYFQVHYKKKTKKNGLLTLYYHICVCVSIQCAENRGYFARRRSVANIIVKDVKEDPVSKEINRRKKRIFRLRKHLQDIEKYEKRLANKESLHKNQIEKIGRKDQFKEELHHLETAPPPTLQDLTREKQYEEDTRPVNGSDDEMSLDDIKKAIEDKERESEEEAEVNEDEDEDGDENNKAEHGRAKSMVVNFVDVAVGDRVRILGNKTGVVRYLGDVEFSNEKLIGIELDSWHPNATDGTVRGKTYFKVTFNLFEKKKSLIIVEFCFDVGKQTDGGNDNDLDDEDETTPPPQAPLPKIHFKIGDYVKLSRGKSGVVKYIGETDFTKGEIIGLELDTWNPCGHNGTVRGKKYFEANVGRGHFTRRGSISQVVIPLVKPLDPKTSNTTFQLKPFKPDDRIAFVNGGATGVIKYIGYPPFAEGEVFGIELDEWSANAHDGSANGDIIFDTLPGRGIFARRDEIEKFDPEKKKLEEAKVQLKIGDKVNLTKNRSGVVKYIGSDHLTDQEIIGIELDVWIPGAHDGLYNQYRYFQVLFLILFLLRNICLKSKDVYQLRCPKGRGIFAKRSSIVTIQSVPEVETRATDDSDDEREENKYSIGQRVQIDMGKKG